MSIIYWNGDFIYIVRDEWETSCAPIMVGVMGYNASWNLVLDDGDGFSFGPCLMKLREPLMWYLYFFHVPMHPFLLYYLFQPSTSSPPFFLSRFTRPKPYFMSKSVSYELILLLFLKKLYIKVHLYLGKSLF